MQNSGKMLYTESGIGLIMWLNTCLINNTKGIEMEII